MKKIIIATLIFASSAVFANDLESKIRDEWRLDPDLNSGIKADLIDEVEITENHGYIVLSINCWNWGKKADWKLRRRYDNICTNWLDSAHETTKLVQGVKKLL